MSNFNVSFSGRQYPPKINPHSKKLNQNNKNKESQDEVSISKERLNELELEALALFYKINCMRTPSIPPEAPDYLSGDSSEQEIIDDIDIINAEEEGNIEDYTEDKIPRGWEDIRMIDFEELSDKLPEGTQEEFSPSISTDEDKVYYDPYPPKNTDDI